MIGSTLLSKHTRTVSQLKNFDLNFEGGGVVLLLQETTIALHPGLLKKLAGISLLGAPAT